MAIAEPAANISAALDVIKRAEEAPEAVVEEVQAPVDVICSHCGFNATQNKVNISESDRREFHRSIQGLRPFSKEVELWEGSVRIDLCTLTHTETDALNNRIRAFRAEAPDEQLELIVKLKLMYMCRGIKTTETSIEIAPPENVGDDFDVLAAFREAFKIPETVIRLLSRSFTEFEMLVDALNNEAFDENFHKGGGVV